MVVQRPRAPTWSSTARRHLLPAGLVDVLLEETADDIGARLAVRLSDGIAGSYSPSAMREVRRGVSELTSTGGVVMTRECRGQDSRASAHKQVIGSIAESHELPEVPSVTASVSRATACQ